MDSLPKSPEWSCELITVTGDITGDDGKPETEELELWKRDPVECIRDLIGNPAFRNQLSYVPEKAYSRSDRTNRVYDEMWTGDWWWEMQVSIGRLYLNITHIRIVPTT